MFHGDSFDDVGDVASDIGHSRRGWYNMADAFRNNLSSSRLTLDIQDVKYDGVGPPSPSSSFSSSSHSSSFSSGGMAVINISLDGCCSGPGSDAILFDHTRESYALVHVLMTSLVLGLVILATIVGNVFVISAILFERNLRTVANYLIASLAVADLMVAALVMPLAAVNEVSSRWFLGPEVCDMWTSFDILCCTSSILHLVFISLDRYWAVTRVDYIHNRSARNTLLMIALSWGLSAAISIPPLFGLRSPEQGNVLETGKCLISQDIGYTVFSTVGAFYLPLIIMIIIYYKIYRAAKSRINKKRFTRGGGGVGGVCAPARAGGNTDGGKNADGGARKEKPRKSLAQTTIAGELCTTVVDSTDDVTTLESDRIRTLSEETGGDSYIEGEEEYDEEDEEEEEEDVKTIRGSSALVKIASLGIALSTRGVMSRPAAGPGMMVGTGVVAGGEASVTGNGGGRPSFSGIEKHHGSTNSSNSPTMTTTPNLRCPLPHQSSQFPNNYRSNKSGMSQAQSSICQPNSSCDPTLFHSSLDNSSSVKFSACKQIMIHPTSGQTLPPFCPLNTDTAPSAMEDRDLLTTSDNVAECATGGAAGTPPCSSAVPACSTRRPWREVWRAAKDELAARMRTGSERSGSGVWENSQVESISRVGLISRLKLARCSASAGLRTPQRYGSTNIKDDSSKMASSVDDGSERKAKSRHRFKAATSSLRLALLFDSMGVAKNRSGTAGREGTSGGGEVSRGGNTAAGDRRAREKVAQKRERKAARTLAIVTGTFVGCWLPFFIVATVQPFCSVTSSPTSSPSSFSYISAAVEEGGLGPPVQPSEGCSFPPPPVLVRVIVWLGYVNSLLNPVIYTIFNPDFRAAFNKMLFRRCRRGSGQRQQQLRRAPAASAAAAAAAKAVAVLNERNCHGAAAKL